jgi:hypothetical protein
MSAEVDMGRSKEKKLRKSVAQWQRRKNTMAARRNQEAWELANLLALDDIDTDTARKYAIHIFTEYERCVADMDAVWQPFDFSEDDDAIHE